MNELEARGKAYFIAAQITEAVVEHMPELFDLAAEKLEVPAADMGAVKREMGTTVVEYLQSQGKYYRLLATEATRKGKRKA